MGRFIIRKVATGCKFDLRAANGETVVTSEVYRTGAACRRGAASVVKNAGAPLEDQTAGAAEGLPNPKFELYRDRAGDFRFRLRARNGQIIAVSEGYSSKAACRSGIESVRNNAPEAEILTE